VRLGKFSPEARAEGAAVPGEGESPVRTATPPLTALVTGNLIPQGEMVVLLLKPSLLFIPLTSMMTLGVAGVIGVAGVVFDQFLPGSSTNYLSLAVLIAAARVMLATLIWMGRYYVLTDMRVMALSGVFSTTVYQCPLRKVGRVRVLRNLSERLLNVGSIEIIPSEENIAIGSWQIVAGPKALKERLQQAVAKARQTGRGA
jgi:uncharacterized membrane protein YdbT with pleckstrin-like domain